MEPMLPLLAALIIVQLFSLLFTYHKFAVIEKRLSTQRNMIEAGSILNREIAVAILTDDEDREDGKKEDELAEIVPIIPETRRKFL